LVAIFVNFLVDGQKQGSKRGVLGGGPIEDSGQGVKIDSRGIYVRIRGIVVFDLDVNFRGSGRKVDF